MAKTALKIALTVLAAALALGGSGLGPALGQNAAPSGTKAEPGSSAHRYRFSHSPEGVLRLDNETGEVVLCRALNGGWVCNPAPQETAVLKVELQRKDDEVKKLAGQFAQLKDEVAALTGKIAEAAKPQGGISQEERQGLVSRLALLEQDNGGLKGALARLEQENAALKKQMADAPKPPDLEPAIAQALAANDALKRELAAAKEQIAALQKQMADQTGRDAQQAEIERLKTGNKELADKLAAVETGHALMQSEIDALKPPPPPLPQADIPPVEAPKADVPPDKKDELKLPSRDDMERAGAALSEAWRRLMDMIGQLRKDMIGGKEAPPVRL